MLCFVSLLTILLFGLSCVNNTLPQPDGDLSYDLLIRGGQVIDGSGEPSFIADVLIIDDRIAFVGHDIDIARLQIDQVLDAEGMVVTPGFIDPHAHGDPLDTSSSFENFLHMGVTTIVLGQDGSSPLDGNSGNASDYFNKLDSSEQLINVALVSGHGSLRLKAGVPSGRAANEKQRDKMMTMLAEDLKAGSYGLSMGLEYVPGMYADSMEIVAMAQVLAAHQSVLVAHMRSEDDTLIESAIRELSLANPYCPTHISHLKVTYGSGVERAQQLLRFITNLEMKFPMTAEVYPYAASYTGIGIVFPSWAKTPSSFRQAKATREDELREFLRSKIIQRNGPEATLFGTGRFAGRTLAQVEAESGRSYVDILMDLGPFGASGAYFVMDQPLQDVFITDPDIAICTDGSPTMRHPRGYGSFARIIEKYVVQQGTMSIENAVRKMTAVPASVYGLVDRGMIKEGYLADILVFAPDKISEVATWADPFQLARGFDVVILNGKLQRPNVNVVNHGRVLRKNGHELH